MERRDGVVSSRIPLFAVRLCSLVLTSFFHDARRMRHYQDATGFVDQSRWPLRVRGKRTLSGQLNRLEYVVAFRQHLEKYAAATERRSRRDCKSTAQ